MAASSPRALAWGEEGHRVIAAIAEEQLSRSARLHVTELLAGESKPGLAEISFWADEHKNRYTAPLHYVNLAAGECTYKVDRDCSDGRCLVAAIHRYQASLADKHTPVETRVTALKMLVHLVGDAHQPLHAGLAEDRGGNLFQIRWGGHGTNLHKLWDRELIEAVDPDWISYARALGPDPNNSRDASGPEQWVEESCQLVNKPGFYPTSRSVGSDYLVRWHPVLESQLQVAGSRLATLLNTSLGER